MNDTSQTGDFLDGWSQSQHSTASSTSIKTKKSNMKTQSTQTELKEQKFASKYERLPAYLTLSPRLWNRVPTRSSRTTESQTVQTSESIVDSSENETIESIIVTKYVLSGKHKKCRPKSLPVTPIQDTTSKEIMVSFKPQKSLAPNIEMKMDKSLIAVNVNEKSKKYKAEVATATKEKLKSVKANAVDKKSADGNVQKNCKNVIYKDVITITGNIGGKETNVEEREKYVSQMIHKFETSDAIIPPKGESSVEESATISPMDNSEYLDNTATEPVFEDNDDPFSTDAKDTTSLDITSLLETSPPSPSNGVFISDSPIEPPPNFACANPAMSSPPYHANRPIAQCYSLDLPSKTKVPFCPQSVSLDNMLLISPESKSSNEYFTASSAEEFIISHIRRHSASPSVSLEKVANGISTDHQRTSTEQTADDFSTRRRHSSSSSKKGTLKRDKRVEYEDDNLNCQDTKGFKVGCGSACPKRMASTGEASDDYTLTLDDEFSDDSPTITRRAGGTDDRTPVNELGARTSLEADKNEKDEHEVNIYKKDLCSPETDSSSSHFTGRESSKSEGSAETLKSESDHEHQETSAEYVTATDNSHRSHQQDGQASLDSISSSFSSPRDNLRNGKVENEPVTQEQKTQLSELQEAVINHRQQQRKHFLKEKMARLDRRRRQIERGMCSTSTESSNSGSYVIESMCKDEPTDVILEVEDSSKECRATEYPIEVNVRTNEHVELDDESSRKVCNSECPQRENNMDMDVVGNGKLKKHSSADGLESSFVVRDKRRTRSASRSPDDTLSTSACSQGLVRDSPMAHSRKSIFNFLTYFQFCFRHSTGMREFISKIYS